MNRLLHIPALLILILASCSYLHAQSTGMQFLNFAPNAQSLGLSEAHTAVPLGSSSIFTNPALLAYEPTSSATLSHRLWRTVSEQTTHATANLNREYDVFGFGIISTFEDDIELRNTTGPSSGNIAIRYLSVAGAYARDFGPLSIGGTGMYLYEQLYHHNASGFALTLGAASHLFEERIRLGAALLNWGQMQDLIHEATKLPTSLRLGIDVQALQFSTTGTNEIPLLFVISTDIVKPLNEISEIESESNQIDIFRQDETYLNIGLRIEIAEILVLRSGYKTNHPNRNISFGAGFEFNNIEFDYGFSPLDTGFGTIHGISLAYKF
ncbi:MAG: PorV/PorQ family protein [Balneolales bacterium]